MNLTAKDKDRIDSLFEQAAHAVRADRPAAISVIADAERALKRVVRRAEFPVGYKRVTFTQDKGAKIETTARLLADATFPIEAYSGQPLELTIEIWETVAGALLAVSASTLPGGAGRQDTRVTVAPPSADVLAMRLAVMDAFEWNVYARSMARKLGWNLIVDVE